MWREYLLRLGLPQTNFRNLAEVRLLMEAGNFFWWALGDVLGQPVSRLRGAKGESVYATIAFLEEVLPPDRSLETFGLDDTLRFLVGVRTMGNLAAEGRLLFDRSERFATEAEPERLWQAEASPHPRIRLAGVFAAPGPSGGPWVLSAPANVSCTAIPALPSQESPIALVRQAQDTGQLGLIPDAWGALDRNGPTQIVYDVDPDRDTNAAGLVYFANYVAVMDVADRTALPRETAWGWEISAEAVARRRVLKRRIAYLAHAEPVDRLVVTAARFAAANAPSVIGMRYRVTRERDGRLLCLSEAQTALASQGQDASGPAVTAAVRGR